MVEATVYHILPPTIWTNLDAEASSLQTSLAPPERKAGIAIGLQRTD